MAGKVSTDGGGLTDLLNLVNTLGGQKTSSNTTGDTSALKALLAQLQGQDYSAVLQSIFQQAAGQLPGLQARMSNAVGARSSNNGAVQAALQKVLQDTTLRGTELVAGLTQKNQGMQLQAASDIGRLTQHQTQQQGTNLGRAAAGLGALKVGSDVLGSDVVKSGYKKAGDMFSSLFAGDNSVPSPMSGAYDPLSSISSVASPITSAADPTGGVSDALSPIVDGVVNWYDSIDWSNLGFANGGLVQGFSKGGKVKKCANGGMVEDKDADGYADGGQVTARAAGGRRSSAPEYTRDPIQQTSAQNFGPVPVEADIAALSELLGVGGAGGGSSGGTPDKKNNPVGFIDQGNGSPIANDLIKAILRQALNVGAGGMMNPTTLIQPIGSAVNKGIGITDALNASPDPIMSMLAGAPGKGVITPAQAATLSSDVLAGAANASSTATGKDSLDTLLSLTNAFGTGSGVSGSGWGSSDNGGDTSSPGYGGSSGAGGNSPQAGYAKGGKVAGSFNKDSQHPVGSTDTVPAMLTPGEFVISADVVKQLGAGFFEGLQNAFHDPVITAEREDDNC